MHPAGILSILDGLIVLFGASTNRLRGIEDSTVSILAALALATVLVGVATVVWPLIERRRPGSGRTLAIIGAVLGVGYIGAMFLLGQPADNPGLNLNMVIAVGRVILYGLIATRVSRAFTI